LFSSLNIFYCSIRLFRIMSIPTMFRLFRVLTSEHLGRRLPVFTLLLWQRQHIIVILIKSCLHTFQGVTKLRIKVKSYNNIKNIYVSLIAISANLSFCNIKGSNSQLFHNTVVSNHVNSDHVPSFSCLDVCKARQTTSGVYIITVTTSAYHSRRCLNIFCKRQISIKLFYLYQRLQCRDNYFFKIKFVFFLYLRLSASWKENDLPLCIYFCYQHWHRKSSAVHSIKITWSGRRK
jgi:hypothetical protein